MTMCFISFKLFMLCFIEVLLDFNYLTAFMGNLRLLVKLHSSLHNF
jgi:hypothetical protein